MDRLFTLDAQFLFDAVVLGLSMLLLFTILSYLLFDPVRSLLEKRRQRVLDDQETAKREKQDAIAYKEEYDRKLKEVDKEAQELLSAARKKAMQNEAKIVAEAKEEAARIIEHANAQIELEKKRALDDMKQEMITIASLMAGKVVAASIDTKVQENLIDETLKDSKRDHRTDDTSYQKRTCERHVCRVRIFYRTCERRKEDWKCPCSDGN